VVEELHSEPLPGLPPLTGGMVGYLGYDVVRRLERLPELRRRRPALPETGDAAGHRSRRVDHHEGTVTLIAERDQLGRQPTSASTRPTTTPSPARPDDGPAGRRRTVDRGGLPARRAAVHAAPHPGRAPRRASRRPRSRSARARRSRSWCRSGSRPSAPPTRSTSTGCCARRTQPVHVPAAPRVGSVADPPAQRFDIVGSSPEALVTVRDGKATTHPIAGTRWRGATEEEDELLEKDLRHDEKERSEHVMLVDLGRNDLGRVCEPGSVKVHNFFSVERYSHVMHLVSTVTGTLRRDRNAVDAVVACFPAGTLSGAPKVRAMAIIEELEPTRRGLYGGIVGYLDFAGNADTAIAIRTALVRDGIAYVQAGGGIVADSDPEAEDTETLNKARAVLSAVATAATLRTPAGTATPACPRRSAREPTAATRGPRHPVTPRSEPPDGPPMSPGRRTSARLRVPMNALSSDGFRRECRWSGAARPAGPSTGSAPGAGASGRRRLLLVCRAGRRGCRARGSARLGWFTTGVDAVGRGTVVVTATGGDLVPACRAWRCSPSPRSPRPSRWRVPHAASWAGSSRLGRVLRPVSRSALLLVPPSAAAIAALPEAPAGGTPAASVTPAAGPLPAAMAAILLLAVGLALLVTEPRLPRFGSRYSARTAERAAPEYPDRAAWEALDAGRDPTAGRTRPRPAAGPTVACPATRCRPWPSMSGTSDPGRARHGRAGRGTTG
jgi:anthranilate synthase component 1